MALLYRTPCYKTASQAPTAGDESQMFGVFVTLATQRSVRMDVNLFFVPAGHCQVLGVPNPEQSYVEAGSEVCSKILELNRTAVLESQ